MSKPFGKQRKMGRNYWRGTRSNSGNPVKVARASRGRKFARPHLLVLHDRLEREADRKKGV